MKTEQLFIENTPAVLYGEPSDTLWLFVHGQFGCKEEALPFAPNVLRMHRFWSGRPAESRHAPKPG